MKIAILKNKKFIFLTIILLILSFVPFLGIFSIILPIKGTVIDSVTKNPIKNISVRRHIVFSAMSPGGEVTISEKNYQYYTNRSGNFFIIPRIVLKMPFTYVSYDSLPINTKESVKGDKSSISQSPDNPNYYRLGLRYKGILNFKYFKNNIIEISPRVSDLRDCNSDATCIEQNSLKMAIELVDEKLCFNIDKHFEEDSKDAQHDCFGIIALAKNDENICDNIGSGSNSDFWRSSCKRNFNNASNDDHYREWTCDFDMDQEVYSLCLKLLGIK
jgi:hypothetical protein